MTYQVGVYVHLMIMTGISAAGSPIVCLSSGRLRELVLCVSVRFNDGSFKRSLGCGFCSGRSLPPFLPSPVVTLQKCLTFEIWEEMFPPASAYSVQSQMKMVFFCDFSLFVLAAHLHLYKTFLELSVLS